MIFFSPFFFSYFEFFFLEKKFRVGGFELGSVAKPETNHFFFLPYGDLTKGQFIIGL